MLCGLCVHLLHLHTHTTPPLNRDNYSKLVPSELRGTFGGVAHYFQSISREELMRQNLFGPHSAYSLCEPKFTDDSITAAISTENCLLNAYRQVVIVLPFEHICMSTARTITVHANKTRARREYVHA